MKINIFKIPTDKKQDLKDKFKAIGLALEDTQTIEGWACSFYLSRNPEIKKIPWVKEYEFFIKSVKPENKIYYAVFLCEKDKNLFALSYGKGHFYLRKFCDENFGLDMAKRIADENEIKQKAVKRFNGNKKKEIRSYTRTSILDNETGESIEHINALIDEDYKLTYGNKAKFGNSLLLSLKDLEVDKIPKILESIIKTLLEKEKFNLPRTEIIKEDIEILKFQNQLIEDLLKKDDKISLSTESYEIIGTDIVFSGNEIYKYKYLDKETKFNGEIDIDELLKFIKDNSIPKNRILGWIKVEVEDEGRPTYSTPLINFIEYYIQDDNVIFQNGKWIKFNEEYVKQIDESVSSIEIEVTESEFQTINKTEPEFNYLTETEEGKKKGFSLNKELIHNNYETADKDFSQMTIKGKYKVEAWDLHKDKTVYAVKFGNSQKLSYVCNQAINVLEIIRNVANLKKLKNRPEKYCLWFGFTNIKPVKNIAEINSIILKQQVDLFSRKCRELNITPLIKISRKK